MFFKLKTHVDLIKYYNNFSLKNNKHKILLACMPKSGSTFLSAIVGNLPSFKKEFLANGFGRREQELDYLYLINKNQYNYICQHHVKFSDDIKNIIYTFGIKPVVLVRDIFDCCISVRDHFRNESVIKPMGYADSNMADWQDADLEYFIATHIMPWYFNFYLSWTECDDKLVVNYSEVRSFPFETVERILNYSGVSLDPEAIKQAIKISQKGKTRKNKAVEGRGQSLSSKATEKILELASFYPDYDLSPIGIQN